MDLDLELMGAEGEKPALDNLHTCGGHQGKTPKGHPIPAAGWEWPLCTPLSPSVCLPLTHTDPHGTRQEESVVRVAAVPTVYFPDVY